MDRAALIAALEAGLLAPEREVLELDRAPAAPISDPHEVVGRQRDSDDRPMASAA